MSTIDVVSAVADHVGGVEQTETSISTINKNNDDDKEISDLMHDFQDDYSIIKTPNSFHFLECASVVCSIQHMIFIIIVFWYRPLNNNLFEDDDMNSPPTPPPSQENEHEEICSHQTSTQQKKLRQTRKLQQKQKEMVKKPRRFK